jgi:hypothetical protein
MMVRGGWDAGNHHHHQKECLEKKNYIRVGKMFVEPQVWVFNTLAEVGDVRGKIVVVRKRTA